MFTARDDIEPMIVLRADRLEVRDEQSLEDEKRLHLQCEIFIKP